MTNLRGAAVLSGLTVNTVIWVTPVVIFAIPKLLIPAQSVRRLMTRWIMAMGENWISFNAVILGLRGSDRLDIRGLQDLPHDSWYLVIANHLSSVDILALQIVMNRRIPLLKFFIKQELIWFPILGIAWWALDFPFMKRHSKSYLAKHPGKKGQDLEATRVACRKYRDTPTSVFNFVEGTRFSEEKKSNRDFPLEYLLPPKAGGVALALMTMGDMFDSILDITLLYPGGVASLWDLCCGRMDRMVIDIQKRDIEPWMIAGDYENDREFRSRFHRWLTQIWQEKDERLKDLVGEMSDLREDMA